MRINEEVVATAVEQLQTWETETQPKVDAYLQEHKDEITSDPQAVLKALDVHLTEFGETIGIEKDSEAPIVAISGDPIQAALQLRGFYIGILAARVALDTKVAGAS